MRRLNFMKFWAVLSVVIVLFGSGMAAAVDGQYRTNYDKEHSFRKDLGGHRIITKVFGPRFQLEVLTKTDTQIGIAFIFIYQYYNNQDGKFVPIGGEDVMPWGPAIPSKPVTEGSGSIFGQDVKVKLGEPILEKFGGGRGDFDLGIASYRVTKKPAASFYTKQGFKHSYVINDSPGYPWTDPPHDLGTLDREGVMVFDKYWVILERDLAGMPWNPIAVMRLKHVSGGPVEARHLREGVGYRAGRQSGIVALPGMDVFKDFSRLRSTRLEYDKAENPVRPLDPQSRNVYEKILKDYAAYKAAKIK